ncbi:IclR family transcriptional regulator [Streptomyces sp. NPDC002596]|uniref:IclR family transcriptional regulator n=1 Tax=Streptomyces sp. NPDC056227 TaxID=3345753 RepID=UPI0035E2E3CC
MEIRNTTENRSVVERAFSVLGVFTGRDHSLSVSDISRLSDLPVATAHRMVTKLVSLGVLERVEGSRYTIGLRLWELAAHAPRHRALRAAAMSHMLRLHEKTKAMVNLSVRDGAEGIWLESLGWGGPVHVAPMIVGDRFPLHTTASGNVLLAYASSEAQEDILARALTRDRQEGLAGPLVLRRIVGQVRRWGYAAGDFQTERRTFAVAAPLRDRGGAVVASLSLVTDLAGAGGPQCVGPLLATAVRISREIATAQDRDDTDPHRLAHAQGGRPTPLHTFEAVESAVESVVEAAVEGGRETALIRHS